jgi:hypothetical protein
MTDEKMTPRALVEKTAAADILRDMIRPRSTRVGPDSLDRTLSGSLALPAQPASGRSARPSPTRSRNSCPRDCRHDLPSVRSSKERWSASGETRAAVRPTRRHRNRQCPLITPCPDRRVDSPAVPARVAFHGPDRHRSARDLPVIYARIGSVSAPFWMDTGWGLGATRHMPFPINEAILNRLRGAGVAMQRAGTSVNSDCQNRRDEDAIWKIGDEPIGVHDRGRIRAVRIRPGGTSNPWQEFVRDYWQLVRADRDARCAVSAALGHRGV